MSQGFQDRVRLLRITLLLMAEKAYLFVNYHLDLFKRGACGMMVGSAVGAASMFPAELGLRIYHQASLAIFALSTTAFSFMYHATIAENGLFGIASIAIAVILTLLSRPSPEVCTQFLPLAVVIIVLGITFLAPWLRNVHHLGYDDLRSAEEGSYSSRSNQATYNRSSARSIAGFNEDMNSRTSTESHPSDFLHIGIGTIQLSNMAEFAGDPYGLELEARHDPASSIDGESTDQLL